MEIGIRHFGILLRGRNCCFMPNIRVLVRESIKFRRCSFGTNTFTKTGLFMKLSLLPSFRTYLILLSSHIETLKAGLSQTNMNTLETRINIITFKRASRAYLGAWSDLYQRYFFLLALQIDHRFQAKIFTTFSLSLANYLACFWQHC